MRRRWAVLCALTAAAVLTPATYAAAAAGQPEGAVPRVLTAQDQVPAQAAGARIAAAASAFPEAFGGTHWDAASRTLYVNIATPAAGRTDQRPALRQAISATSRTSDDAVRTVFRPVPLSVTGQQRLVKEFMDGRADWGGPSAVRNVVGASVDEATGRLTGTALTDVAGLTKAARQRFGDVVDIVAGQRVEVQDRYYDTAPWTSGNALWDNNSSSGRSTALCTQGFNWRRWSDNARYASTAGHCFDPGVSAYNGNTAQRIGYVGTRYLNNGEYVDFEPIHITYGSVDNSIWVGGNSTGDLRRVVAADNDGTQTGDAVCSSGANGGLVCGTIVNRTTSLTYSSAYGSPTLHNITCVKASSSKLTVGGDSGGPWLSTFSNGTVMAWGQHIGRADCDHDGKTDMMFSSVKNIALRTSSSIIAS
jgi:hypothetical protein